MSWKSIWQLANDTVGSWMDDKAPRLGAALAFYSAFSIAPLLILAIGIASLLFGEQAARGEIVGEIASTVGRPAAHAIEDLIKQIHMGGDGIAATVIGLAVLLFGASGVFIELQDALNTIWKVTPKTGRGIWGIVQDRFLSFTVVLGTCFLLLVSLIISAALAWLSKKITPDSLPGGALLWEGVNFLISLFFLTILFAGIFKILPDVKIAWCDVWIGAIFTSLLFSLGKFLIGLYLGQSSTTSAFGAAGSLVLVLLWIYYSSQILLLGAEFTRVYMKSRGTRPVVAENAEPLRLQAVPNHATIQVR